MRLTPDPGTRRADPGIHPSSGRAASARVVEGGPESPEVVGRSDPGPEREAGGDGSGDVRLGPAHRLRHARAEGEQTGQRRGEGTAGPVGVPVVLPDGGEVLLSA